MKWMYCVNFHFDKGEKLYFYNDLHQLKDDILWGDLNMWFKMCKGMNIKQLDEEDTIVELLDNGE